MANVEIRKAFIGVDIGGSGVRSAGVKNNQLITEVEEYSHPDQPEFAIVSFRNNILSTARSIEEQGGIIFSTVIGMPDGSPNPTDYAHGILRATHKPRLVPLCDLSLERVLKDQSEGPVLEGPIHFINDGDAFGFGVAAEYPQGRTLAISLGTGLGSSFVVDGRLATEGDGAPPKGEIWDSPFRKGKLEDYVSRSAIKKRFKKDGGEDIGVKEIIERARSGDERALKALLGFGKALGEGVAKFSEQFHPDRIVIGGNLGIKTFDIIGDIAQTAFNEAYGKSVPFSVVPHGNIPIIGAARYGQTRSENN